LSERLLDIEFFNSSSSAITAPIHCSVVKVCASVKLKAWITLKLFSTAITAPSISIKSWASFFDNVTFWAHDHTYIISSQDSESSKLETIIIFISVSGNGESERSSPAAKALKSILLLLESTSWLSIVLCINRLSLFIDNLPTNWISVWAIVSCLNDIPFDVNRSFKVISEFPSTSTSIFVKIITVEWSTKFRPVSGSSVPWSFLITIWFSSLNSLESGYTALLVVNFSKIIGDSKVNNFISSMVFSWYQRCKTVII